MCGSPEMESYEEFCLRTVAFLQEEGKFNKVTSEPACSLKTHSVIRFYGRAVLSPLLSAEQRTEMNSYRERAVLQEVNRQNQKRNELLARVQDVLDQTQTHKVQREEADKLPVSTSVAVSGYTLVTDSSRHPSDRGFGLQTNDQHDTQCSATLSLSGYSAVAELKVERRERSAEEEEDISLDSLLKKSREYVKREQCQQGSKVTHIAKSENVFDKENTSCHSKGGTGIEFGFSLHHSPTATPQTQSLHQTFLEPVLQQSGCLLQGLPDQYVPLRSPESSIRPCARRRRPRPVSAGNIHISFPISPADLVPRSPGRSREGASMADWGEASKSPDHCGKVGREGLSNVSSSGNHLNSNCGTSPVLETCSPILASMPSAMGHHDHSGAGFRRRCHTIDSQLHNYRAGVENIDRSKERVPRFMAGAPLLAPGWRSPVAPLTQSYEVENPCLSLPRPLVTPDLAHVTARMEPDGVRGSQNGRITSTVLRNAPETQESKTIEQPQRQVQALEDMQRRLEEEHALQMSLLLAEQEKEQQRLRLELEETERRLMEQQCARPLSGDACGWKRRSISDSCPAVSPSQSALSPAHTPPQRAPGHGFPSPVTSSVCAPSVQPPVYLWGTSRAAGKPRGRLSLVLTAEQQRTFSRLGAITRGFLTRRLLKTEKVKHLRQTIVDTREFIRSFQSEAHQKKCSLSAQDLSLQERVKAQLRAALYDIHDIFFEMPLGDQLALVQQDRELCAEKKLRDLEKTKSVKERVVLSAATQRAMDRKKRVGESPAQARKMQQKPKSPTTNRILKPSQCSNSPVPGQLKRQGSWYRKTPEERVKRSESLKKQNSLG